MWLPISSQNHTYTNFIDSLFIATSATCVTGLVTVDTGTHWSYFGKTVILAMIQVGGLGFYVWQEIYNLRSFRDIKKMSLHSKVCIIMTIILSLCGSILFFLFEFDNPATMKYMI